jgi:hypothetical protein
MRTAIAQAGAERVLLILAQGGAQRIVARATTSGDTVTVHLRDEAVAETVRQGNKRVSRVSGVVEKQGVELRA